MHVLKTRILFYFVYCARARATTKGAGLCVIRVFVRPGVRVLLSLGIALGVLFRGAEWAMV